MNKCKRIISISTVLLLLLSVCSFQAFAASKIEPDRDASLTIEYEYDGTAITGARYNAYRIASVDADTSFKVTDSFKKYPVNVENDTVDGWNELAATLSAFIQVDGVKPDHTGLTNENGVLSFNDLKTGLYLLIGDKTVQDGYSYSASPVVVCVPNLNKGDNQWDYDVTILPKSSRYEIPVEPSKETVTRKVLKAWDDNSDSAKKRPAEITVQLICDGKTVYDTVKLNAANNWRYTWEELPEYDEYGAKIEWSIIEKEVKDYTVKIEQSGVTFAITNSYTAPEKPDNPPLPQTGMLWWPVPVLALLGVIFITIGIRRRSTSR